MKLLGVPAESSGPGQDSSVDQRTLLGVTGTFLPGAKANPESHAIAVVLGRVLAWGLANNLSTKAIQGMFAQLHLAGVNVGQRYHSKASCLLLGALQHVYVRPVSAHASPMGLQTCLARLLGASYGME